MGEKQFAHMWHPGSKKPERPVFQPRDRGEVFWNTALLSIEQISSLLQATWVQGRLHRHGDTMPPMVALCKQQNSDDGDELHSAGTLVGTLILARKQGIHDKQAIKSGMTYKLHDKNSAGSRCRTACQLQGCWHTLTCTVGMVVVVAPFS